MKREYTRPYILYSWFAPSRRIIRLASAPTRASYPHYCAIGPFQTMRGAKFMLEHGSNNPHCRTVADAERLGRKYAAGN